MIVRSLALTVLLLMTSVVQAAQLDWSTKKYSHFSDQEPLSAMLQTLAATENTPIIVSPKVNEVVSMHYKLRPAREIFDDLVKTHGLIWFFDGETLFVYKEEEAQRGSVSLEKMSPREFTTALERLNVLDDQYHWEVSEIDNVIYFVGPERFVSSVLDMAKMLDGQTSKRTQVFKWVDANGQVNYSNERPVNSIDVSKDVSKRERFPGFDVVDVINR